MKADVTAVPAAASADTRFFGHPRGLSVLFFTEMWERFSYYGMRALLILFMTATIESGGLGFPVAKAGAVYGLYTAMVYMVSLPGGWIADRILGARRSVLYGGIIIALGHYSMVVHNVGFFYLGLCLIVIGTGLLKPNVSTMVGSLYTPADARRDAGFSIFYMGINLGSVLAPIICSYLGEQVNWHFGFGAAGVGMTIGVIWYLLGSKHLGTAGLHPASPPGLAEKRQLSIGIIASVVGIITLAVLAATGGLTVDALSAGAGAFLLALSVIVFAWIFMAGRWTKEERARLWMILILFMAATLFWSAFEQAGSSLNLFAQNSVDRHLFGYEYPAGWFQSLNGAMIIVFAPVFAWLWIRLGDRNPSSGAKFAIGLVSVGLGFAVLIGAAAKAQAGVQVSGMYLVVTYFFHTVGELCLSPVGLSATTKLAPARVVGLMMGIWFLALSCGNYIGGRVASVYGDFSPSAIFAAVAAFSIGLGVIMALFVKPMQRLSSGVN